MALIKLYAGRDLMEAHYVRTLLEDEGIRATIMGENLSIARGDLPLTQETLPSVWIEDDDRDRAMAVIDNLKAPPDKSLPDWRCPQCDESVEGQFDVCWKCGTTRDGAAGDGFEPVTDFTPRNYCRNCGYDLRGLTGSQCPECGEPFE